jgi:hypothetical protein
MEGPLAGAALLVCALRSVRRDQRPPPRLPPLRPPTEPLRVPAPTLSAPAAGPRPLPDKAPKPLNPLALEPPLPDEVPPPLPEPLLVLPLDPGLLKELEPTLPPPLPLSTPLELRPTGLWLMPPRLLELLDGPRLRSDPPTLLDDCPRLRSGVLTPLDPVAFAPVPEPSTPPAVPVDVPGLALKPVLGLLLPVPPPDPNEVPGPVLLLLLAPGLLLVPDGLLKLLEPELAPAPTPPVPLPVPPPGLVPGIGVELVLPPACARTIGGWFVLSASARAGGAA